MTICQICFKNIRKQKVHLCGKCKISINSEYIEIIREIRIAELKEFYETRRS